MKLDMRVLQSLVTLCCVWLITADDYEKKTNIWSVTGAVNSGASVVNYTSDSIVIPTSYHQYASARRSKDLSVGPQNLKQYVFRPRAIPLKADQPQEKNVYYSHDKKYKTEILFPGNYFTIAKEKSNQNLTRDSAYSQLSAEPFKPRTIPLMRGQDFQKRSLGEDPAVGESEESSVLAAARRSLSYVLGVDDDEENEEEEGDEEIEDDEEYQKESKSKIKHKLKKAKKYSKYMMPLLLAYKLKYFALVPVMISGLILLVGATGMAGFFFALFAAVMGLQKGGY